MSQQSPKKKIAFLHRYGPADHIIAGGHSIPTLIEKLTPYCEVHYFGFRTKTSIRPVIKNTTFIHYLPYSLNRGSILSKVIGTLLWYLALPLVSLRCRIKGVNVVFMDETLPLTTLIMRIFYGRNIVITVADFFLNIYTDKLTWMKPLVHTIERIDFYCWKRLPLIFTKVHYTQRFLINLGIPAQRIVPVYNPCDTGTYFPESKEKSRQLYNIPANTLVLVHHGVLHPNKGNDLIIRALSEMKGTLPDWRYLLIGAGPEIDRLKRLSIDLNVSENIIFTGWLPGEKDVNLALNAGDIGLVMRIGQPSDDFHLTDTLVHEMAVGLPILAARLKGIEEIITDNESGLLFDPRDMEEFKKDLLELTYDPNMRASFGLKAGQLCKIHFDVDKAAEAMARPLLKLAGVG